MRLTAVYSVSTFGVGLALAAGLGRGDTRLPSALVPPPTLHLPAPNYAPCRSPVWSSRALHH